MTEKALLFICIALRLLCVLLLFLLIKGRRRAGASETTRAWTRSKKKSTNWAASPTTRENPSPISDP